MQHISFITFLEFVMLQPNWNFVKQINKVIIILQISRMCFEEEFEDTKGVIRIRISKKNRQRNGQKKK